MKVELAAIADYASTTQEGKLNILGIFDVIYATQEPTQHPMMHLVMRFNVHPSEFGRQQRVTISLADEDGGKLFEVQGQVVPQGKLGEELKVNQVLNLSNVVFPKAGRYAFDILINDNHEKSIPLTVRIVKPEPTLALGEGGAAG